MEGVEESESEPSSFEGFVAFPECLGEHFGVALADHDDLGTSSSWGSVQWECAAEELTARMEIAGPSGTLVVGTDTFPAAFGWGLVRT